MYCSIDQAIDVWEDLKCAYDGKNGYGGYTAEIYAYRLMKNVPGQGREDVLDMKHAADSLIALIEMFIERYTDARITIEDLEYKKWQELYGSSYGYRVHVTVEKTKK